MKQKETVDNIRRIKEIYRRQSVPRATIMAAYTEIHRSHRAARIRDKMRRGMELRSLLK